MPIDIKLEPQSKKVIIKIDTSVKHIRAGIKRALHKIGVANRRHARSLIRSKEKTGRLYVIKGKVHQASAPHEAPANLSGTLAKSIFFKVSGPFKMEFGAAADYAGYLEFGTHNRDGSDRMVKRPYLSRTIEETREDAISYLQEEVDREIKS